jgi:hypothetical protein
VAGVITLPF